METKKIEELSVLGDVHKLYAIKTQEGGGILDDPMAGKIEMYPAGYTKPSPDGYDRQETYKILYELAVQKRLEAQLYPFGLEGHAIELVPDPKNPYDSNAIKIILRVSNNNYSIPRGLDGRDLGFVPKKINQQILKHLNWIHGGRILKVKGNFHGKYCGAKIVLGYGNTTFTALAPTDFLRFKGIMEE